MLWNTGGRLSENTNLKIADVDFTEKVVRLFGKGRIVRHAAIEPARG